MAAIHHQVTQVVVLATGALVTLAPCFGHQAMVGLMVGLIRLPARGIRIMTMTGKHKGNMIFLLPTALAWVYLALMRACI